MILNQTCTTELIQEVDLNNFFTDDLPKLRLETPHYSYKFTNTDEMQIMVLK